ncbi:hypothetical protein [Dactylosporangium sp. CA-233914]|uniref:hypothetical protein n=1 Tax=Dactylosporangium sp. CA-233914 TaxID=3239934 RepID=UPI003D903C2B
MIYESYGHYHRVHSGTSANPQTPAKFEEPPFADGIAAACRAFGLQAGIRVVNDSPDRAARALVFYGPTTIQRLARLGVWIEHGE